MEEINDNPFGGEGSSLVALVAPSLPYVSFFYGDIEVIRIVPDIFYSPEIDPHLKYNPVFTKDGTVEEQSFYVKSDFPPFRADWVVSNSRSTVDSSGTKSGREEQKKESVAMEVIDLSVDDDDRQSDDSAVTFNASEDTLMTVEKPQSPPPPPPAPVPTAATTKPPVKLLQVKRKTTGSNDTTSAPTTSSASASTQSTGAVYLYDDRFPAKKTLPALDVAQLSMALDAAESTSGSGVNPKMALFSLFWTNSRRMEAVIQAKAAEKRGESRPIEPLAENDRDPSKFLEFGIVNPVTGNPIDTPTSASNVIARAPIQLCLENQTLVYFGKESNYRLGEIPDGNKLRFERAHAR
jgi:hypothetical protein